ncbi:MAG: Nramp family divalent metal transporter [Saprospiraceae bacterium]|nr:Nramp family divalent metal transporter [Saprospiraceae bacterium]
MKQIGPGALVAAAFIGPGTVTLCSLTGYQYGYTLLWAMLFSIITTLALQEMSARLGVVSQNGLGEAIRSIFKQPIVKALVILLVFSAIVIGNAAYEAGNISGAVLGLEQLAPRLSSRLIAVLLGFLAFVLLLSGKYKLIERLLIGLVLLMSVVFLLTAILTQPNFKEVIAGLFQPQVEKGGWLFVIGLIGTTVVPYNLFLHASAVSERWKRVEDLPQVRFDTIFSILLGGIISMCIIVSAAAVGGSAGPINNAADLAQSLELSLGSAAASFMAIGLFAAGLTSAITAPLAAAFAARGIFGWKKSMTDTKFRLVWMAVLLIGVVVASLGLKPILVIQFAQVANGLILPFITILLMYIMNQGSIMGLYRNENWQNFLAGLILIATLFISGRTLINVF